MQDDPAPKKTDIEDTLAERESALIANGNYEEATKLDDFRSNRRFKRLADAGFRIIFISIMVLWSGGALLSLVLLFAPIAWTSAFSAEERHIIYSVVGSSFFTNIGTKYFNKRLGL